MFPTRKRIVRLHVNGKVIRTTGDHPFYVEGKGWINVGEMPGAKCGKKKESGAESGAFVLAFFLQ